MKNIAVFVSGGGTNLQALIDAANAGKIKNGRIACVISSSKKAYALQRAADNGIEALVLRKKDFSTPEEFDQAAYDALQAREIDLVVLAGYLSLLGKRVLGAYENRIINIHPSLIPSFCGKGFYGLRVHEAALEYGVKVTGATVHFVNEVYDSGKILLQKAVEVQDGDTPEILQKRVMEQAEWVLLPQAVAMLCDDQGTGEELGNG